MAANNGFESYFVVAGGKAFQQFTIRKVFGVRFGYYAADVVQQRFRLNTPHGETAPHAVTKNLTK
jgi:hypothetical protein